MHVRRPLPFRILSTASAGGLHLSTDIRADVPKPDVSAQADEGCGYVKVARIHFNWATALLCFHIRTGWHAVVPKACNDG